MCCVWLHQEDHKTNAPHSLALSRMMSTVTCPLDITTTATERGGEKSLYTRPYTAARLGTIWVGGGGGGVRYGGRERGWRMREVVGEEGGRERGWEKRVEERGGGRGSGR